MSDTYAIVAQRFQICYNLHARNRESHKAHVLHPAFLSKRYLGYSFFVGVSNATGELVIVFESGEDVRVTIDNPEYTLFGIRYRYDPYELNVPPITGSLVGYPFYSDNILREKDFNEGEYVQLRLGTDGRLVHYKITPKGNGKLESIHIPRYEGRGKPFKFKRRDTGTSTETP